MGTILKRLVFTLALGISSFALTGVANAITFLPENGSVSLDFLNVSIGESLTQEQEITFTLSSQEAYVDSTVIFGGNGTVFTVSEVEPCAWFGDYGKCVIDMTFNRVDQTEMAGTTTVARIFFSSSDPSNLSTKYCFPFLTGYFCDYQLNYASFANPAAVPLPAALPLMLFALFGLGFAARRHRWK